MDLKTFIADIPRRQALAKLIDCEPAYLYQVATDRRRAGPELAKKIHEATLGMVDKATLRPDLWDLPEDRAA